MGLLSHFEGAGLFVLKRLSNRVYLQALAMASNCKSKGLDFSG